MIVNPTVQVVMTKLQNATFKTIILVYTYNNCYCLHFVCFFASSAENVIIGCIPQAGARSSFSDLLTMSCQWCIEFRPPLHVAP